MGVMFEEQETVINIMRTDDYAEIYTSDSTMMTKLDKCVTENPKQWFVSKQETVLGKVVSKTYICPKKFISFRKRDAHRDYSANTANLMRWREQNKKTED